LAPILERCYRETGILDLFYFADSCFERIDGAIFRCSAKLNYFDRDGQLTEVDVEDLFGILGLIHPKLAAERQVIHNFPLEIHGIPIHYRNQEERYVRWKQERTANISFSFQTDIWFPWVNGPPDEPRPRISREKGLVAYLFRNLLAREHTPRLNRFLSGVKLLTEKAGGRWELDDDHNLTVPGFGTMIHENGIDIDAPLPPRHIDLTP
jgi:hypothetical protein